MKEIKHAIKECDSRAQDSWAELYMKLAVLLNDRYALDGRSVIREAVRRYAREIGSARRQELLTAGCHVNIETLFAQGFGFPAGAHCRKEWIRHTEEELFLNVAACPYAAVWSRKDAALGRMFCEEFYPVLLRSGTSEKAQNDLGQTLLSGRDNICRISMYLRPANLSGEQRAEAFPEFDAANDKPDRIPEYVVDYEGLKDILLSCFISAARDILGEDAVGAIKSVLL